MLINKQSNRPASARSAVVFCCDENYLPYALFAANQIIRQHPDGDFDVCLCHTDKLALPKSLAPLGIRVVTIDTNDMFDGFGLDARRTASTYLRLALPDAFSGEYDRILYLDSDIFVQGGDIAALLNVDLAAHPVAAVRDNMQWRTPNRLIPEFKQFGIPNAPYFNAGIMLIDVQSWQRQKVLDDALTFGASNAGTMPRNDQTLLNVVLHKNWAELSPVWNWQYSEKARLFEPMVGANILHFIGPRKPWTDTEGELPPMFLNALSDFLTRHMPKHALSKRALPPLMKSGLMRRMLLRHLISLSKMQNYLRRFPTDLTTYPQERT